MAPPPPRKELVSILYEALGEPIGLLVQATPLERGRALLYAARTSLDDPDLACLQIRASPFPGGNLVICKTGAVLLNKPDIRALDTKRIELESEL